MTPVKEGRGRRWRKEADGWGIVAGLGRARANQESRGGGRGPQTREDAVVLSR